MKRTKIERYTEYIWEENDEEFIIPGYQLIDLLNFWRKNGKKCTTLLDCFNLFKEVK